MCEETRAEVRRPGRLPRRQDRLRQGSRRRSAGAHVDRSLSKAIAGACIGTLVRNGKLALTTPLRDALPQFFKLFGQPAEERRLQATVEELLVHRAGLRGNADDDPIYGIFNRHAGTGEASFAEALPVLAEYVLKERLARIPGGRYSYSNTGYELLTAIVEEQTGRSYEDYCRHAAFGALGLAQPSLHPDWRMLAGNRNRWYNLGVNTWAGAGRWAVAHGGIMNAQGRDAQGRTTSGVVVSQAFRAANGTAVFIALDWTPEAQDSLEE